jgi:hypothetical protein
MWTDGQTDITKLIVALRNFVKAPNKVTSKQLVYNALMEFYFSYYQDNTIG